MTTLKANAEAIRKAVKGSAGKRVEFRIEGHAGLVLRTRSTEGADWYFYFTAHKLKKLRLGPYDGLTLADAAKAATEARAKVAKGTDPTHKALTFSELTQRFLDAGSLSAKTRESYDAAFKRDVLPVIGLRPANQVTASDVSAICQKIQRRGSATQAQRTKSAIGGAFSWGRKYAGLQHNPARDVPHQMDHPSRSERVPTNDAIVRLWTSLDKNPRVLPTTNLAIKLLILTGQRRDEVGAARVNEIDLASKMWTIPPDVMKAGKLAAEGRMKNGREQRVYLSDQAAALFNNALTSMADATFVFPAEKSDAKIPHLRGDTISHRVRAVIGTEAGVHDFRRAFAGWMRNNGFGRDVRDLVLAHKEAGSSSTVDEIYSGNAKMVEQCRAAWQGWADHIEALITAGTAVGAVTKSATSVEHDDTVTSLYAP